MTDEQQTCEQRIDAHLASRLETIGLLIDAASNTREDWSYGELAELDGLGALDDDGFISEERAQDRLDELPLAISTKTVCTVLLSTGGPADFFEFEVEGGQIESNITYAFQDWFDGATRRVDDPAAEAWLEQLAELVSYDA